MSAEVADGEDFRGIPRTMAAVPIVLSIIPMALIVAGVPFGPTGPETASHHSTGPALHMLFEWSSVCLAFITAYIGIVHFLFNV